jgi:PAS domain S-box-containing protein
VEVFVTDVSARHAAIEEITRLEAESNVLLQSANEGIAVSDADGRCTVANDAALRMLLLDGSDVGGRHVHDVIHSGCIDAQCWMREPVTGRDPVRIDDILWRGDATHFPAEIVASPIMVSDRRLRTVWSFLDISERIATAKRLEVAERVAGLGRLASSMAHEFNNVLMAILPVADVLERRVVDERLLRLVKGMKASVLLGKKITDEVLQYSREHEPVVQSMPVAAFLSELRDELAGVAGANIAIRLNLPDESLHLTADRRQLRETFLRVAENARNAMPKGGVLTISAVRDETRPSYIDFAIADNGIGMSREVLARALEPMFTTNRSATGLGLALAERVIRDHGGEIFIESVPGKGTTVHLLMPLDRSVPPHGGAQPSAGESHNGG